MATLEDPIFSSTNKREEQKPLMKVSVVIPAYNERAFIEELLLRVQAIQINKEVLVIDDASTDGTQALLRQFENARAAGEREVPVQNGQAFLSLEGMRFIFQEQNCGKGAALRRGLKRRPAISYSYRMRTSNTTRRTMPNSWPPSLMDGRMLCMVRGSSAARSAFTTSGIMQATNS